MVTGSAWRPTAVISAAVVSRLPAIETASPDSRTDPAAKRPSPSRSVRAAMATSYPACASAIAVARPMPRLAPVTSAIRAPSVTPGRLPPPRDPLIWARLTRANGHGPGIRRRSGAVLGERDGVAESTNQKLGP